METLQPKLRFPEFSGDWSEKIISDVSSVTMGQSPSSSSYNTNNDGLPLIQGNADIKNRFTEPRQWTNEPTKKCKEGDLILTVRAPVGFVAKSKHNACIGRGVCSINSNNNNLEFIYQFLLNFEDKWSKLEQGSTFTAVSGQEIKAVQIKIPNLKEQAKIANFLSVVDTKINQLTQKKSLLEQYKKGVMQKIFTQEKRFKDDNGNDFADWHETFLGDICDFENGKAHENDIDENGDFVVVNSKFVSTNGKVRKYTNSIICKLQKNDIAMVMSDVPNGKAIAKCFFIDEDNKYSLNQRICKIKILNDNSKFIFYLIDRNPYYLAFDSGVGQTNLRKNEVLECPLYIPTDIKEQTKIANFISAIDENINQVSKQLEQTTQYKKGLLQQMFV